MAREFGIMLEEELIADISINEMKQRLNSGRHKETRQNMTAKKAISHFFSDYPLNYADTCKI